MGLIWILIFFKKNVKIGEFEYWLDSDLKELLFCLVFFSFTYDDGIEILVKIVFLSFTGTYWNIYGWNDMMSELGQWVGV